MACRDLLYHYAIHATPNVKILTYEIEIASLRSTFGCVPKSGCRLKIIREYSMKVSHRILFISLMGLWV